jgi:hypothetical protein
MIGSRRSAGSRFCKATAFARKSRRRIVVLSKAQRGVWTKLLGVMITATSTWTDIHNFEEDASGYQRTQLGWALVLAAALVLVTALLG